MSETGSTATVTYLSPAGRKMSKDVIDRNYAGILKHAQTLANRPGVKRVQIWSQGGRLLASLRAAEG